MTDRWYKLSPEHVLQRLQSSESGLDESTAAERLAQHGPNEIAFQKTPAWVLFLRQFNDPMVIILLATALVTGVLTALGSHMLPDTVVILSVVLLNAILGFVQEGKAEGALDALRNMMVQEALVIRCGDQRRIPARELVPGDLVVLEGGDKIPADVRFIDVSNIHVDESSLTGESVPVEKLTGELQGDDLVPGDQLNVGFSGTYLTRGTARAMVVETGANTVFGRIADMVKAADVHSTPLQRKMKEFVRTLIIAILIVGAFNFGYGIYLGYAISYSFLGAVSLVVAAIPEMLPALVTSILALSGMVMAGRKALIRKLPAAETLGATSVICSDKTGTLTENRMTVTRVYAGGEILAVTGTGLDIEGEFRRRNQAIKPAEHPALMRLLRCGFDCNNAHLSGEGGTGDPTELALRISGAKAEIAADSVQRLVELPFDSSVKYMAVLVEDQGQRWILVKGAPEVIVDMCSNTLSEQGECGTFAREQALGTAKSFAVDALRTLGFAEKQVAADYTELSQDSLRDMCFVGLQGMIDPPKQSAIEAVEQCKRAGIRTVMITGDHPDTAQAVARQLGIAAEKVMTGAELNHLQETQLRDATAEVSVFARVAPEHKKAIAEALQAQGLVVAMTGDGVNDAPALKAADIGIAMGISGTEVAKESSDMVLADDNFATIVAAVEEGRHAWNNLQKAILYTLPTNAAQALLIMGAIIMAAWVPLFGARFVLEPVQILWINLLDSVLLTMPLMMEGKEKGLLDAPPRPADAHIIDALFLQRVVIMGFAIAIPGFLIYYHFGNAAVVDGQIVDALLLTQAQTAAFWAILLAHFGYVMSARSIRASVFTFNPLSNHWLLAGIALSIAIRFIPTLIPEAAALFRTAPFPPEWWPLILLCFLPSFIAIETDKLLRRVFA
ncbi:cation-translocating P-type ATPase [Pseudohalioglobus lutimaris]|uniref:ATPase n=1 Tax=Pseudohalioglobus lutimaris TaxID=1737061 RepID=A0A2N5X5G1_9GAMM|nr:HAD-IC family P-type ATPase [Pseudohalioglobus lutimaris]PLW69726.1 ATPase [Pseudohalioglobus lutimaris]